MFMPPMPIPMFVDGWKVATLVGLKLVDELGMNEVVFFDGIKTGAFGFGLNSGTFDLISGCASAVPAA